MDPTARRPGPQRTDPARAGHRPTFLLLAHRRRSRDLARLVRVHRARFARWLVLTVDETEPALRRAGAASVERIGGRTDVTTATTVATTIAGGSVDVVILLADALSGADRDGPPDVLSVIVRACDVHSVPLATNLATASLLIRFQADHDNRVAAFREGRTGADDGAPNCPGTARWLVERSPAVQKRGVVRAISVSTISLDRANPDTTG